MKVNDLKGLYIAHRGIHTGNIIENTIPAFSFALEKKVPIELDIHILKDGSLVVFHDENLKRLVGIDRNISDYTYDELKKITFPDTNIHIPLFEDVLDLISGKVLLVVEIKKSNIINYKKYCDKVISILKKYQYDFVVKSFDIRIVSYFLKKTSYITGLLIANPKRDKGTFYDVLMNKKITLSILKPYFISVDYHIVDKRFVQLFRKKGPVLVWTVCNLKILDRVKDKTDSYLIEKCYFI